MKKNLLTALFLVAMGLLFATTANALPINPTSTPQWTGNQTSQAQINEAIAATLGSSVFLYGASPDDGESGALADAYDTVFANTPEDPSDATITWTGPDEKVGPTAFLLVKDGDHSPAWYLYNLTSMGWDGEDALLISDFWPDGGAISHVSLYGNRTPVSEPATLLLLGVGLIGLAGFGRKLFK